MGAISGLGVFLSIGYIWKSKKIRTKIIYGISALIMLVTMILTYSRFVYIMFALAILIYGIILCKKYKIKEKITKKKLAIIGIIIILAITYIAIGLNIPTKLEIGSSYQKIMYTAKPNEKYKFTFDIESKAEGEQEPFIIKITEKNKYFDEVKMEAIKFGSYTGTKEIEIETDKDTSVIYINIEKREENSTITVNNAKLNDKQIILKYKILPTNIVQKVQGISLKNKSLWERTTFIKDGIKSVKNDWLFGLGGQAWKTIQYKVQSYNYYAEEMHSFPIKVLMENGILGFIASIGIFVYLIKMLIKECKKDQLNMANISIIIGTILILLHSLIDFDLSFFYCLLIVELIISVLSSKEEGKVIKFSSNVIYVIILIASIIGIHSGTVQICYKKEIEKVEIASKEEERVLAKYYKAIPYSKTVKDRYNLNVKNDVTNNDRQKLMEDVIKNEKYENTNVGLENIYVYIVNNYEKTEALEKSLQYIIKTEDFYNYSIDNQVMRLNNFKNIINFLNEKNITDYKEKFENQFTKEIEEKDKYLEDYGKCRTNEKTIESFKEYIENLKKQ